MIQIDLELDTSIGDNISIWQYITMPLLLRDY
jgi:hypothetical protein